KTKPLWGTNQWTKHVPSFREKYEAWIQKLLKLGLIVMEAFLYADPTPSALQVFLGPDTEVAKHAVDASLALPPEQGDAEGIWINADPIPGAVVCNIGEMWETWTCGLYRSTLHRPNFDALVQPLDAALRRIKEERCGNGSAEDQAGLKAKYPPVVYGEFLKGKVGGNFTEES
ncbi:14258_t:CDS:2, partial [Acaulospora colombiana]